MPAAVCSVPGAHEPCGTHVLWFGALVYVPLAHAAHTRSLEALPGDCTKEPAAQTLQLAQLAAFAVVLKVPLGHAPHVRSRVAEPAVSTRWPAAQFVHATHAVAASPSWSHVPPAQACLGVAPPGQKKPAGHAVQTAGLFGVAGTDSSVPASHAPWGRHASWFWVLVKVPAAHALQPRSTACPPGRLTNAPGSQWLHGAHAAAFTTTLNEPLAQLTHVRSVSTEPSVKTCCPGRQSVCGMHAVAAFASSSHVPAAHATRGAAPPAQ